LKFTCTAAHSEIQTVNAKGGVTDVVRMCELECDFTHKPSAGISVKTGLINQALLFFDTESSTGVV